MVFEVGAGDFLVYDTVVVYGGVVGCGGGGEEEEGEFEGACGVDAEDVFVIPLGAPGLLSVYWLMGEGVGGDGVEIPHLMVDGFIVSIGGLIDEPDFDGVVDEAVFVVCDADDDGGVF